MIKVPLNNQSVSERGQVLYERNLRSEVETEENIGKILIIDVETGNYAIDANGLEASRQLRAKHPDVKPESLFAIRVGYNSVFAVGGAVTRTTE
jgi:hypothetical protein